MERKTDFLHKEPNLVERTEGEMEDVHSDNLDIEDTEQDISGDDEQFEDEDAPSGEEIKTSVKQRNKKLSSRHLYNCDECDGRFKTVRKLSDHKEAGHEGHEGTLLACKQCDYKSSTPNYLRVHMVTHSDERPYKCNLCPKTFKLPQILKKHIQNIHSSVKYECNQCKKVFKSHDFFNNHMLEHHNITDTESEHKEETKSKEGSFQCDHCDFNTHKLSFIKTHNKFLHKGA